MYNIENTSKEISEKMTDARKRYPFWLGLFLVAYYVTNSVYQGYLSVYFSNTLKLSSTQIGAVFSLVAIVSVVTQPFWGMRGDRMKSRNRLIRILCICASALMLLLSRVSGFVPVFIITGLFAAFYMSIQPLGDSIILAELNAHDHPFGPIRLMGGLSFAVFNLVFGAISDAPGREILAIYFVAGLLLITFASTYVLPFTPGKQAVGGRKMGFGALFRNRELMLLLLFVTLLQCTMGYFYTFFSIHFKSLEGANSTLLGWCYFIAAVCEAPYLIFSDRLFKKLGVGRLLLISACVLTARWLFLGFTKDYRVAMLSQCFHGFGFIVMTVASAKYISLTVPEELKASGQMLLAVASFGIARVVGNFGGGFLSELMGGNQPVFFVCAGITIASLICFAPYYLRHKPLNGED